MKSSLLDISNAFVEGEPLLTSVGLNLSNAINSAASRVSLLPKFHVSTNDIQQFCLDLMI